MDDQQFWAAVWEWSPYVAVAAYIGWKERNAIKSAIVRLYQDYRSDDEGRREFSQDIHLAEVEAELQSRATQDSREWWSQEKYFGLIREQLQWSRDDVSQLQGMLQFQAARQTRIDDKLLLIAGTLAEVNERLRRLEQHAGDH